MSRKTQIGWMSVGVLLCLFSIGLTLKLRDGNKVVAQEDDKPAATKQTEPPPFPISEGQSPLPVAKPSEARLQPPEPIAPTIVLTGATEPPKTDPPPPPVPTPMPPPSELVKPLPGITQPAETKAPPLPAPGAPDVKVPPLPVPGTVDVKAPPLPAPEVDVKPPMPPVDDKSPPLPKPSLSEDKPPMPNWTKPQPLPSSEQVESPKLPKPMMPEVKKEVQPVSASTKQEPGEPPMIVPAGPVQIYQVRAKTETLPDIARRTLGSSERAGEIVRLNPDLKPESVLPFGATVRLPPDACIQDDSDALKPLPSLRPKEAVKAKVMPLTGTYPCNLDERKILTLPKAIREQLGNCDTVLVSPGPDHCLWLTNHAHLERLAERIEHSTAQESDVRVFKRLYYAQTEKASVTAEGRIAISDKLTQFAGLSQELVLVGIDEHFELWDAARWKQYTQQKSAAARSTEEE